MDWIEIKELSLIVYWYKRNQTVAISETRLKEDDVLNYFGYIWEGENHRNARKADRGVGFLIKKDI